MTLQDLIRSTMSGLFLYIVFGSIVGIASMGHGLIFDDSSTFEFGVFVLLLDATAVVFVGAFMLIGYLTEPKDDS